MPIDLYLDTSAFNAAVDSDTLPAVGYRISSSLQVLAELASTYDVDAERARALCGMFSQLVDDRIVRPALEIQKEELRHLAQGTPLPAIYLSGERLAAVKDILSELCSGTRGDRAKRFSERIRQGKVEYREIMRAEIKPDQRTDHKTLDDYILAVPAEELLAAVMGRMEALRVQTSVPIAASVIVRRRLVPHFWALVRTPYAALFMFERAEDRIKPKWGLNYDMTIVMNAAGFGTFVTEDNDSGALFRTLFPDGKVLCYKDIVGVQDSIAS